MTLTAAADANYELSSWSGACSGSTGACELTMDMDREAGASFVRKCLSATLSNCRLPETSSNETAGTCVDRGSCSYRCGSGQWELVSNTCCSPRDGGWSDWSSCSASACGEKGEKTRTCTNPEPGCEGASCIGDGSMSCTGNTPVDGVCDNTVRNGCSAGKANDGAVANTGSHYRWRCDGLCNGAGSPVCEVEIPKCAPAGEATGSDDACQRGDYSEVEEPYKNGACSAADWACTTGSPRGRTTTRVDGKCKKGAVNECAAGTFEGLDDTADKRRWKCNGTDGNKQWMCQGTTSRWEWSCSNAGESVECRQDGTGRSASCTGSVDRANSPVCEAGLACGAHEETKLVGNNLVCVCVANAAKVDGACKCNFGFEADGNSCRLVCPSNCERTACADSNGSNSRPVCKCPGSSCPAGYAWSGNCSATTSKSCNGDTDGCGRRTYSATCTTPAGHSFSNVAPEICRYEHRDRSWFNCRHRTRVCRANVTHIGCVKSSSVTTPGSDRSPDRPGFPGPEGFGDEEWSDLASGYLLPTFECGTTPNSCDVAFEGEVLTTTDHGVVDKADTLADWVWECRSDNGTVRRCSLPKDGG